MAKVYKAYRVQEEAPLLGQGPTNEDVGWALAQQDAARLEGYQSGYKEGFSQGLMQEQTKVLEQTMALSNLIQGISSALNACRLQQASEITNLVLAIASQLFIHQQQDASAIKHQVTHLLTQLNEKQSIHIKLHPQDWVRLQASAFMDEMSHYTHLQFSPDETLRLGGCVMNSEHGLFDASIERQIDNLKHVLLQMKHEPPND